ncbi:hypothetical protein BKD09_24055 [Bradyrhizobium japonicum]|uniref:Uncharacterized protein n=1 Tax=Bradyrhizobium japonicum TaxID=375 RepID=A0A1L3FDU0_BRAJP|nr:hypothetical protein [Bradyrhizobium japonicum]APG11412.1 hypothetical protein BKD09_24055 [Bradyrhizobium japonicum]
MTKTGDLGPQYQALLDGKARKATPDQYVVRDVYTDEIATDGGKPLRGLSYADAKAKADKLNAKAS